MKNSFIGNVFKILSGNVTAHIIALLILPVITRMFTPEAFGLLGIYTAIVGVVSVFVCFRYELAILIPGNDIAAGNIYWLSLFAVFFWVTVSVMLLWFFSESFLWLLNIPELKAFVWLIPVGIAVRGMHTANMHWNTRKAAFGRLAVVDIGNSLTTNTAKLAAGFAGLVSGGYLIASTLLGTFVAAAILGKKIWQEDGPNLMAAFSVRRMVSQMKRFKNISIFNSLGSLFNSVAQQAPLILFAWLFSPVVVGYYVLAYQLLKKPTTLVTQSVKKVYFQKASLEKADQEKLSSITALLTTNLALTGLLFTTLMVTLAGPFTAVILGDDWVETGRYIQWLSLWILGYYVTNPVSSLVTIFRKEHIVFFLHIIDFFLKISAILVGGIVFDSAYVAVALYSLISFIFSFATFPWVFSLAGVSVLQFLKSVSLPCLFSLITIILTGILYHAGMPIIALFVNGLYLISYIWLVRKSGFTIIDFFKKEMKK